MVLRHLSRCSTKKMSQGYVLQQELWQGKMSSSERQALVTREQVK